MLSVCLRAARLSYWLLPRLMVVLHPEDAARTSSEVKAGVMYLNCAAQSKFRRRFLPRAALDCPLERPAGNDSRIPPQFALDYNCFPEPLRFSRGR